MAAPLASYKVAAVNENWSPLIGIEIEAMNLDTLLPDSVQTTGRNGVATFSGLPAGPHFFRARHLRVSTRVQSTLDPDRGRTFTGVVHLQVIAIGGSGIAKHAVVDAGGFGTHTTVQSAVNAVLAQAVAGGDTGGSYIIHINPGTYAEQVDINLPIGIHLTLEAQGGPIGSKAEWNFNEIASITRITLQSDATVVVRGFGKCTIRGLSITANAYSALRVSIASLPGLTLENSAFKSDLAQAVQFTTTNIEGIRLSRCLFHAPNASALGTIDGVELVESNDYSLQADECTFISKGVVESNGGPMSFEDCIVQSTGAATVFNFNNRSTYKAQLRLVNNHIGMTGASLGVLVYGDSSLLAHDNVFMQDPGDVNSSTGIYLGGARDFSIEGNRFWGLLTGVNFADAVSTGGIIESNIFSDNTTAIAAEAGKVGAGVVIGPNAYRNNGTNIDPDVPPSALYTSHTILDGSYHTDTLLGVVVDGDIIIGNVTPKWSRLAISIPAANVRNVLGIDNGELRPSWKTALDATLPETIVAGGSGAAGTSLVFSHRDHNHPAPSTWPPGAHTHAHGDLTGVTADQHHAGFIGFTIAGPANIDPDAGDRITFVDSATVTWDSPAANQVRATAIGGVIVPAPHDLDGASHTGVADYTSVLGLSSLTIGDANFGLIISGGNPALTWDTGDFIQYIRASNYWSFAIGGANMGHIGLDQFRLTLDGTVSSPDNAFAIYIGQIQLDPADGWAAFGLYGGGTVVATAGQTVSAAYGIYSEAMAKSGTGTITTAYGLYVVAPTIGTTNIGALIGGQLVLPVTGSTGGLLIGGDVNLYHSAANVLKTDDGLTAVGHLAVGGNMTTVDASNVFYLDETFSGNLAATARRGFYTHVTFDPNAATTGFHSGFRVDVDIGAANVQDFDWLVGGHIITRVRGTGAKDHVIGLKVDCFAYENNAVATDVLYLSVGGETEAVTGSSATGLWGLEINNLGLGWDAVTSELVAIEILAQNAKGAASAYGLQIGDITNATTVIPIYQQGTTGHNRILAKTVFGADRSPGNYALEISSGSYSTALFEDTSADSEGARMDFKHLSATPAAFDIVMGQHYYGYDSAVAPNLTEYGLFRLYAKSITDGTEQGLFEWLLQGGAGSLVTTMQLDYTGQLKLPVTGVNAGVLVGGDALLYRIAADVFASPDSMRWAGYERVGSTTAPTNTTAGDLTCVRLFVGDAAAVAGKEALITGDMAITGTLVIGTAPNYTVTNAAVDRTYDADATTLDEIADVLGTLLADLTTMGLLQ